MKLSKTIVPLFLLTFFNGALSVSIEVWNNTKFNVKVSSPGIEKYSKLGGICPGDNKRANESLQTVGYVFWKELKPNQYFLVQEICENGPQKGRKMVELLAEADCIANGQTGKCKIQKKDSTHFEIVEKIAQPFQPAQQPSGSGTSTGTGGGTGVGGPGVGSGTGTGTGIGGGTGGAGTAGTGSGTGTGTGTGTGGTGSGSGTSGAGTGIGTGTAGAGVPGQAGGPAAQPTSPTVKPVGPEVKTPEQKAKEAEAPGAPGAPEAPSEAPEAPSEPAEKVTKQKPSKPKAATPAKPEFMASGILVPEETKSYSREQQLISDKLFTRVLKSLAQDMTFVRQNAAQAYLNNLKKKLVDEVGKKTEYKKRTELDALLTKIQTLSETGLAQKDQSLEQYLEHVYEQLGQPQGIVKELVDALAACAFSPILHIEREGKTIIASIAVLHRPVQFVEGSSGLRIRLEPTGPQQTLSDEQAREFLTMFVTAVQNDANFKKYAQDKVEFDKKTGGKRELMAAAILQRDYIEDLYQGINRLRVHPEFFKFVELLGKQMQEQLKIKIPFLNYLLGPLASASLMTHLKSLFYGETEFEQIWPKNVPLLEAIISDHARRVSEQKEELLPFNAAQLNGLVGADTAQKILAFFNQLKLMAALNSGQQTAVVSIETAVRKPDFGAQDVDVVDKGLTDLGASNEVKSQVRKVLEGYGVEKATVTKVLTILRAAKAEHDKTQKAIDGFIIAEIVKDPKLKPKFSRVTGIYRVPSDLYSAFSSVAGAGPVKQIITKNDFVAMVDLTGLLLSLLKNIKADASAKKATKAAEVYDLLVNSLESLNRGQKAAPDAKLSPVITINETAVATGEFRGKLDAFIAALKSNNLQAVQDAVHKLATDAGYLATAENTRAFDTLMNEFLPYLAKDVLFKMVQEELAEFNKGNPVVTSMPLSGDKRARNLRAYNALANGAQSLVKLLNNQLTFITAENFDKAKNEALESIRKKLSADRDLKKKSNEVNEVMQLIEQYFNSIKQRVLDLQKASAQKVAPTPAPTPSTKPGKAKEEEIALPSAEELVAPPAPGEEPVAPAAPAAPAGSEETAPGSEEAPVAPPPPVG